MSDVILVFYGLIISVITLLWFYGKKNYNYWQRCGVYNKKPFFPFLGNLQPNQFLKSNLEMVQDLYNSASGQPYAGIYFMTTPALVIRDLDVIRNILVKDFNYFVNRGFNVNPDQDEFANNMIHLRGKYWKQSRSKLQPFFAPNMMKLYVPEIDKLAIEVVERIEKDNADLEDITFNASVLCDRYLIDVITLCCYGIKTNTINEYKDSGIYNVIGDAFGGSHFMVHMFSGFFFPKLHTFFKMTTTPEHVMKFFTPFIEKVVAMRKSNTVEGEKKNFLDGLIKIVEDFKNQDSDTNKVTLENGEIKKDVQNTEQEGDPIAFDEKYLTANAFTILPAGYDSTSKIAAFAIFEVAYNNDIQHKAREEILNILAEHEGILTLETIQKMTYIDQIIAETNRKYPLLSIIFRKCVKHYEMPNGAIIEPGVPVMIPSSAIHFDPTYFPNPQVFDPERFSDENKQKLHPSANLSFGLGPRMCLAPQFAYASIKLQLVRTLLKYQISLHPSCQEYPIKLKPKAFLVSPENHILINAKRIQ